MESPSQKTITFATNSLRSEWVLMSPGNRSTTDYFVDPVDRLRKRQFVIPCQLSIRQSTNRAALLKFWITTSRDRLQLKYRTIDMAIRLFDYYCFLKHQQSIKKIEGQHGGKRSKKPKSQHILDNRNQSILATTACFFSAAKFNEVYPPGINDFIYLQEEVLTASKVVAKQIQIVQLTDCNYTIATITDWYYLLSGGSVPEWGYTCLLHLPNAGAEQLAKAIHRIEQSGSVLSEQECVRRVLQELGSKVTMLQEKDHISRRQHVNQRARFSEGRK